MTRETMTAVDLSERFETAAYPADEKQSFLISLRAGLERFSAPWNLASLTTMSYGFRNNMILTRQAFCDKEEAIRNCLQGNEQGQVDLWMLRELALCHGGLLTLELRKLAWPKLTGCHAAIVSSYENKQIHPVIPTASSLDAIRHGVSQLIWNVEDCRRALKVYQKQLDRTLNCSPQSKPLQVHSVRFAQDFEDSAALLSPLIVKDKPMTPPIAGE
jgi:hypothetical protein